MSKSTLPVAIDRPVVRSQQVLAQSDVLPSGALVRPVEPLRTNATISFDQIVPEILDYAPIHFYLRPWCDGRYSEQCLRRMLTRVIDQGSWHALCGVREWRYVHSANCVLIEALLAALDEQEEQVAA